MENTKHLNRSEFLKLTAGAAAGISATGSDGVSYAAAAPVSLKQRPLGKTGLTVSTICFGAGRMTDPDLLRAILDRGVTFIDTGRTYQNGQNEQMIGRVIQGKRKELVVSSKISGHTLHSRTEMERSLEASLRALRTDYLDILFIHGATSTDQTGAGEAVKFFADAKQSGKIRCHGFTTHQNQHHLLREAVREKFYDVVMIPYTHAGMFDHTVYGFHAEWNQTAVEREMANAVALGMGIVAMKVCSAGPAKDPGGGKPSYLAAIRWALKNPHVSSIALTMANFEEMNEDLKAMEG
jgi:aryl-alcohol dehydrogenase-like predicted oxidoreductase